MKLLPLEDHFYQSSLIALEESCLFGKLKQNHIKEVMKYAELIKYDANDTIIKTGEESEDFFVLIDGQAKVYLELSKPGTMLEIGSHSKPDIIGEIGVLLNEKRSATVIACMDTMLLRFNKRILPHAMSKISGFALALSQTLAQRLYKLSDKFHQPGFHETEEIKDKKIISYLPINFIIRHRALPLEVKGNEIIIGFVDFPEQAILSSIEKFLPGMEIRSKKISLEFFNKEIKTILAGENIEKQAESKTYKLNELLDRMVTEGASDLHLSAMHQPCWRIDGRITRIKDSHALSKTEASDLLKPVMTEVQNENFKNDLNIDFAYTGSNKTRFRINLYQDYNGANAAIRMIPAKVLSFEQLGLPVILTKLCDQPNGLVLVTGPTGCGKTTTLACLINYINENFDKHIITLEDPIEYVHESKQCLVNQRELYKHVKSFKDGLKSGLREDPDVILVGEMRDYETISLALECSNTGHLVFATLHTPTAIATIERIIQVFPNEQQNKVRSLLADNIRGIICQTLCRRVQGGTIPALEVLAVNPAIANMIREGKLTQIPSMMQTSKHLGNMMMNDYLAGLVKRHKITHEEALRHAIDKQDMKKRI